MRKSLLSRPATAVLALGAGCTGLGMWVAYFEHQPVPLLGAGVTLAVVGLVADRVSSLSVKHRESELTATLNTAASETIAEVARNPSLPPEEKVRQIDTVLALQGHMVTSLLHEVGHETRVAMLWNLVARSTSPEEAVAVIQQSITGLSVGQRAAVLTELSARASALNMHEYAGALTAAARANDH